MKYQLKHQENFTTALLGTGYILEGDGKIRITVKQSKVTIKKCGAVVSMFHCNCFSYDDCFSIEYDRKYVTVINGLGDVCIKSLVRRDKLTENFRISLTDASVTIFNEKEYILAVQCCPLFKSGETVSFTFNSEDFGRNLLVTSSKQDFIFGTSEDLRFKIKDNMLKIYDKSGGVLLSFFNPYLYCSYSFNMKIDKGVLEIGGKSQTVVSCTCNYNRSMLTIKSEIPQHSPN